MSICYEVIPWDLEGFAIYNRQFPSVNSLDESSPPKRTLTAKQEVELGSIKVFLLQGRQDSNLVNKCNGGFATLAQQCRCAARRSHSHGWLPNLEWDRAALERAVQRSVPRLERVSGAFAFGACPQSSS
jgi:hypothetical protein